jgi:hypothetical protein
MLLRLDYKPIIDNPRKCPPEAVEELRRLLAQGAPAIPDPHRKGFYDVEDGERVFYVHLAPNRNVWLLATWLKSQAATSAHKEALAERACAFGR